MTSFVLQKEDTFEKIKTEDGILLSGYDFTPKKKLSGCISIEKLVLISPEFASLIATKKVRKKYEKLMLLIQRLWDVDDDTGTCLEEILNEVEKFRLEIATSYKKYLQKEVLRAMAQELSQIQKQAKLRLYYMNEDYAKAFGENGKSR